MTKPVVTAAACRSRANLLRGESIGLEAERQRLESDRLFNGYDAKRARLVGNRLAQLGPEIAGLEERAERLEAEEAARAAKVEAERRRKIFGEAAKASAMRVGLAKRIDAHLLEIAALVDKIETLREAATGAVWREAGLRTDVPGLVSQLVGGPIGASVAAHLGVLLGVPEAQRFGHAHAIGHEVASAHDRLLGRIPPENLNEQETKQ